MARPHYYRWRVLIRPRILLRAGGVFAEDGAYLGLARCERCGIPDRLITPWEGSELDVAHLDGDFENEADGNLAALCRLCHRALDYRVWSLQFQTWLARERQRQIDAADERRPLLRLVRAS